MKGMILMNLYKRKIRPPLHLLRVITFTTLLMVGCNTNRSANLNTNLNANKDANLNDILDTSKAISESNHKEENILQINPPEFQSLIDNDFIIYYVNCATQANELVAEGDNMGLFQSLTDQKYGRDAITGAQWGYHYKDYMIADGDLDTTDKMGAKWAIKEGTEYVVGETGFYYDFQLPKGRYEITCGFNDPFSARTITVVSEGDTVVDNTKILKFRLSYILTIESGKCIIM